MGHNYNCVSSGVDCEVGCECDANSDDEWGACQHYKPRSNNPGYEEPQSKPIFSLRLDDLNPRHARVSVFNRGGNAGTLCIDASDLSRLAQRLADNGTFALKRGEHGRREEIPLGTTEYYECAHCKQVVQGWHAAHEWYSKPCKFGCTHEWQEIPGPHDEPDPDEELDQRREEELTAAIDLSEPDPMDPCGYANKQRR